MGSISPQKPKAIEYGKRLLPTVLDEMAIEEPTHVLGMSANSSTPPFMFSSLTAAQLANAVNCMAYRLDDLLGKVPTGKPDSSTIAFVGLQDFRYWVMELAAMKTGRPLLMPSPKNVCLLSLTRISRSCS